MNAEIINVRYGKKLERERILKLIAERRGHLTPMYGDDDIRDAELMLLEMEINNEM